MTKDLSIISEIIFETSKIPVTIFNEESQITSQYGNKINPLFESKTEALKPLLQPMENQDYPIIKITDYMETFLLLPITLNKKISNHLLIGPFSTYEITESMINGLMNDYQLPITKQGDLVEYFSQLIHLKQKEIISLCRLTFYLLYNKQLDPQHLKTHIEDTLKCEKGDIETLVRDRRINETFHMDYREEQLIWQCIKEGNKEGLKEHLNNIKIEGIGTLSKISQIRNFKNHAIISVALATRAAIDGGLYPEIAYTMSDFYIQKIEETLELNKINLINQDCLFSFIDRINENKNSNQSKPVQVCKNYIFNHIFDQISVQDLADKVNLNHVYLSQLFKKETGYPIGKYIQIEKLKESQKLLVQTDLSVADICMMLQFNDQSYFTSIFRKYSGQTPNQYRKNPNAINT
ncbi:AraC family transcriptional regulator [Metabacillus litoralis]|uniref:helix-turn-helix domain-containing protein n=1 Tax=Metabacillus litoralis TaxID=152268 RepID=UPI002041032B|nr:helix-turn-helix domain-containing protein [Metabacillus litoralis]MCM3160790.1 AraC family transcriptional regulator [Metabacillus litoralis]